MREQKSNTFHGFQIFFAEVLASAIANFPTFLLDPDDLGNGVIGPVMGGIATYLGIWCAFTTSGAHINPMVTTALILTRRERFPIAFVYFVADFTGTIGGMALSWALSPYKSQKFYTYGMTMPTANTSLLIACVTEGIITFILLIVILASLDEMRAKPWQSEMGAPFPLAVMFSIIFLGYLAGPISGASMNPFRSICAAIIDGCYTHQWIYFVGPIIGTLLACLVYELLIASAATVRRSQLLKYDKRNMRKPIYDRIPPHSHDTTLIH